MNIGENLLNLRKRNNLSQEDLAREIGVTRQTISKWELNETSPDLKQTLKLTEIFNISLNELLQEKKKEKNIDNKRFYLTISVFTMVFFTVLSFIISVIFYNYGYREGDSNHKMNITMECSLDGQDYGFSISYDETSDIIMIEGSQYIFDNIYDRKIHKKYQQLMIDTFKHFENHGGKCN